LQSLVGFEPGAIVPVQLAVAVCPAFAGTVTSLDAGDDARVPIAATRNAVAMSPSATPASRAFAYREARVNSLISPLSPDVPSKLGAAVLQGSLSFAMRSKFD